MDNANPGLDTIFNKEKEQQRLREAKAISDIGVQVADIARTKGAIDATKAAQEKMYNISPAERDAAITDWQNKNPGKTPSEKEINDQVYQNAYDKTFAASGMGTGCKVQQAIQAATGEAMGMIALEVYGKDASAVSEQEKQTVSALATLASGLAGGLAGDSTSSVVSGALAGKTTVENNYLSSKQIDAWSAEMKQCQAGGGDCSGINKKYEELSTAQQKQLISDCATSPASCQQKYGDVLADSMSVKQAIDRTMGEDIPLKMVYDLTATWAHQMDADGIVASNKVSEQIMAKYGLDQTQADIIAGVALSALGGVSKGSKLPTGAGKNIVIVDSGKKGAWNKTMNNPEPNTIYKVDGDKTYHTDELTRTTNVSA